MHLARRRKLTTTEASPCDIIISFEALIARDAAHFFSFQRASKPTPDTLTTLNRTPGISPLAFPRRPKPEIRTSSFSSVKLRQPKISIVNLADARDLRNHSPSLGTKAVTFLPFLMSWTRTHFRIAELGCLASTPT